MKRIIVPLLIAVIAFGAIYWLGNYGVTDYSAEITTDSHTYPEGYTGYIAGENDSVPAAEKSTTPGSPYKYYYRHLDATAQQAYNNIISKIYNMPDKVRIPKLTQDELNGMYEALIYDNPDIFFLDSKCTQSSLGSVAFISFSYKMSKSEYKAALEETEKARDAILSSAESYDEWNKELAFHNAIVENTEYEYTGTGGDYATIYGALVNGSASCEGYSKAFKYLCDSAGMECYVVTGSATDPQGRTDAHMWNVVRVNGSYCQVDVTWDDPVGGTYSTFAYFNITDDRISLDHTSWHFDYDCTTVSQSYSKVNGLYFTSFTASDDDALASAIASQTDSGITAMEVTFSSASVYANACRVLVDDEEIYNVLHRANKLSDHRINDTSLQVSENEDIYVLTIIPEID